MTKKDYIAIGQALKEARRMSAQTQDANYAIGNCIDTLSRVFEADNPKFDKSKFVKFIQAV
jgi:hypothetical protein